MSQSEADNDPTEGVDEGADEPATDRISLAAQADAAEHDLLETLEELEFRKEVAADVFQAVRDNAKQLATGAALAAAGVAMLAAAVVTARWSGAARRRRALNAVADSISPPPKASFWIRLLMAFGLVGVGTAVFVPAQLSVAKRLRRAGLPAPVRRKSA